MNNNSEQLTRFKELVQSVNTCMMITKDADGKLTSRPMSTAKVDEDGSLWFFTNEYTGKVEQISHENEVYLTYANPSKNVYIAFNATASLHDDKNKIDELWNPMLKAWFPEGKDDPKILLIKANPQEAEYWEGSANKIVLFFHQLKAAITGNYTDGEHGTLTL